MSIYGGYTLPELKEMASTASPGGISSQAEGYTAVEAKLRSIADDVARARGMLASAWRGDAADAASASFTRVIHQADNAAQVASTVAGHLRDAAGAAATAQSRMAAIPDATQPPAQPADAAPAASFSGAERLGAGRPGAGPGAETEAASAAYASAHGEAVRVMDDLGGSYRSTASGLRGVAATGAFGHGLQSAATSTPFSLVNQDSHNPSNIRPYGQSDSASDQSHAAIYSQSISKDSSTTTYLPLPTDVPVQPNTAFHTQPDSGPLTNDYAPTFVSVSEPTNHRPAASRISDALKSSSGTSSQSDTVANSDKQQAPFHSAEQADNQRRVEQSVELAQPDRFPQARATKPSDPHDSAPDTPLDRLSSTISTDLADTSVSLPDDGLGPTSLDEAPLTGMPWLGSTPLLPTRSRHVKRYFAVDDESSGAQSDLFPPHALGESCVQACCKGTVWDPRTREQNRARQ